MAIAQALFSDEWLSKRWPLYYFVAIYWSCARAKQPQKKNLFRDGSWCCCHQKHCGHTICAV